MSKHENKNWFLGEIKHLYADMTVENYHNLSLKFVVNLVRNSNT